jgi:hypothetical protein
MDMLNVLNNLMRAGPWFVVAVLSLLVAYEAVKRGGRQ